MAIKVQGTTVIDDSRNFTNINSVTFADGSVQSTAAASLPSLVTKTASAGSLLQTLNNINAYSTSADDNFAYSVAIDGNYAIVGAYQEDDAGGADSGKVYIYNVTTGALLYTLNDPNAYGTSAGDNFGSAVAISGNYAIVGARMEYDAGSPWSGKAYIFNVTTGQLVWTLNNPNAYSTRAGDFFGTSVAISGNYAIVGVYAEDDAGGADSGKAYIFNVTTGQLVWTLNNPNAYSTSAGDRFGISVGISGNYAIIGADNEGDAAGAYSGKAYIYNVNTGALLWTLNNPNAYGTSYTDYFGYSVAISGNYAIVGAYNEYGSTGFYSGKAYIFNVATGQLVWTLNDPNAYSTSTEDYFGYSVAISGNYAIVGTYAEDDAGGASSGKAYIFNVTTGALLWTLNNPNAYSTSAGDYFGNSVAISGNYAIVSARYEDDAGGNDSGKAYIYTVTDLIELNNVNQFTLANGSVIRSSDLMLQKSASQGELVRTLDDPNAYGTSASDQFGKSVAISGNYAIVGAWGEDDASGTSSGKAYIFNVTTGQLLWTLDNPNPYSASADDQFGQAVAISSEYAIISAPLEDDASYSMTGKVYVFNVITGKLIWTLSNPISGNLYYFGHTLSIDGNYAIIGSRLGADPMGAGYGGIAYIFNMLTGQLVWTLNNPNSPGYDGFSSGVAISGNNAIVGAYFESDTGGYYSGKAYIYNVTTGALLYTLNNPNPYGTPDGDYFGSSVAISGNYAIVGAPFEDDASGDSGKAYIYNVTTGALLYTLNNPNPYGTSANDYFGNSVAISGNYAIVSVANESDAGGTYSGKTYIYNVTTGALLYTLNNPNTYSTSAGDNFGNSVGISGNYVIVSAYREDSAGGADAGKAYIFAVTDLSYLDRVYTLVS